MAGLNAAEAFLAAGESDGAINQARAALRILNESLGHSSLLSDALYPSGFGFLRVEWERAAWEHAGDPKAEIQAKETLLRWRLHALLAETSNELLHAHEAAVARPDLPPTRALLGRALCALGHHREAVPHLRFAVRANPFDGDTAGLLFEALGKLGDAAGQLRLIQERRLLHKAAPGLAPAAGSETRFLGETGFLTPLSSLVVLCCNELEFTQQCLESVLAQTKTPYELIVVDNGSTDATPAYLASLAGRPGPERLVIVRNDENCGFPAGCNQALAHVRGSYVVFLNNDTVVTEGWLEGLIAWAKHDWPNVGLVGAVTNYASPPQQIECDYQNLGQLQAFATKRQNEYARRAIAVDRLSGFCLLARREVLDKIGGFDERFGLGFFDDDDLGLRVRAAGYRLLVALNVFIHHYGSRTFRGLGIDCRRQLVENFRRFEDKWGAEHCAGYRLPDAGEGTVNATTLPTLPAAERAIPSPSGHESTLSPHHLVTLSPCHPVTSLCVIAKNEEANLGDCLASAAGLFDESIVVDTGSTDRTKEIAAEFGAKVVDFPWIDHFAAARNEALRHATGDWIFWMDADDRLDEVNRARLRDLLAGLDGAMMGFVMKCLCLPDPRSSQPTVVDHIRLFPRHPEAQWEYRVHEQILPSIRRLGGAAQWTDVVVQHVGYQEPGSHERKLARNLRLLRMDNDENPDSPYILFNLGIALQGVEGPAQALPHLCRSLELSAPSDSIVRKLHVLILQCHVQLGQMQEAIAVCKRGLELYPNDAELLLNASAVLRDTGNPAAAEDALRQMLEAREGDHFASVPTGLRSYVPRHHLAELCESQGRPREAEAYWNEALAEAPDYLPAWVGSAYLLLRQERWVDLEALIEHFPQTPSGAMEAKVLKARLLLAQRQFDAARTLLEETIAQAPTATRPREALTFVLLQEGRDWQGAEKALRELLQLDPVNAEAKRNLEVLLRKQSGMAG